MTNGFQSAKESSNLQKALIMKHLVIFLAAIISSTAFAGNLIQDEGAAVGAKVILRQIANRQQLGKDGLRWVIAALEGSKGSSITADIKSIECEPSLGSIECMIGLEVNDSSRPTGFQNWSFDIQAKVYQGRVVSGGPVPLEY